MAQIMKGVQVLSGDITPLGHYPTGRKEGAEDKPPLGEWSSIQRKI
jgi:hypothetical protein